MVKGKSNLPFAIKKTMDAVKASISFCGCLLLLAGCGASLSARNELANELAAQSSLRKEIHYAAPFYVTAYADVLRGVKTGRVYIEGDGLAWVSKSEPSLNPTPIDPYALRLAEADHARNIDRVYLARPCQYSGWDGGGLCPHKYWTSHRYAPEVVDAYVALLDKLKQQRGWSDIELVGYSGGATLALLIARGRGDITAIRTVAGNVDIDAHSRFHKVSLMPQSLNPANYSDDLSRYPQIHFVGGDDRIVPINIAQSYAHQMQDSSCVRINEIAGLAHGKGWVEKWPDLLRQPISCKSQ